MNAAYQRKHELYLKENPALADRIEVTVRAMEEGYTDLVWMDDVLCGLLPMLFTHGLFVDLDLSGYSHRFCYDTFENAREALYNWKTGDPIGKGFITVKGIPFNLLRRDL